MKIMTLAQPGMTVAVAYLRPAMVDHQPVA